ncbi:hypothetical protein AG1IA_07672 [Rhizoctonia solani AG-1 IA]|uniref:Uncharacterized protein n=1 Tax=Thanatephorus cucumeris (strain AG1-IA) TaxID=983506 RepID=L8WJF3_THACA|nr:hypothetical protein AG1IA_07672 [Rhizoctonia solani AG-1 IA]
MALSGLALYWWRKLTEQKRQESQGWRKKHARAEGGTSLAAVYIWGGRLSYVFDKCSASGRQLDWVGAMKTRDKYVVSFRD